MKKLALLIMTLVWVISGHTQDQNLHQLELKGGFLIDQDDQRASFLEEEFGEAYRLNYKGLQYIAVGYTRTIKKTKYGTEIDYFKYGKLTPDYSLIPGPDFPPGRYKQQFQIGIFYGGTIVKNNKFDLYIAPITSLTFRKNTLFGGSKIDIDSPIKDLIIALGGKIQANVKITNLLSFSLGNKLMVFNYYVRNEVNSIIRTRHSDFIRGDLVFQTGLVLNI